MRNRVVNPRPWWQVGLATLLGMIAVIEQAASMVGLDTRLNFLILPTVVALSVSSILWVAVRQRAFGVAAWGLIPLGLLAGVGLYEVSAIQNWGLLKLYSTHFVLVGVGLFLVKHSGLGAGLFVLSGGLLSTAFHIEAVMYFWDSPFWTTFVQFNEPVFFFIVSPMWVLRSRSVYGQAAGLLLPVAAYFATLVLALSAARGFPIAQSMSIGGPALILLATVAAAAILYARVSSDLTD